jgi:hypothetical protein
MGQKLGSNKDDHYIDRVEVEGGDEEDRKDEDAKLVELVNQYMTTLPHEFEVVSVDDQYGCND